MLHYYVKLGVENIIIGFNGSTIQLNAVKLNLLPSQKDQVLSVRWNLHWKWDHARNSLSDMDDVFTIPACQSDIHHKLWHLKKSIYQASNT